MEKPLCLLFCILVLSGCNRTPDLKVHDRKAKFLDSLKIVNKKKRDDYNKIVHDQINLFIAVDIAQHSSIQTSNRHLNDQELILNSNFGHKQFLLEIQSDTVFSNRMDFTSATFNRPISFNSYFKETIFFDNATFLGNFNTIGREMQGDAIFTKCTFKGNTKFGNFLGIADFSSAHFQYQADFYNSQFNDTAVFKETKFDFGVDFSNAEFSSSVDFSGASFNDKIDFGESRIVGKANFQQLNISDSTRFIFDNTVLADTLLFSYNERIPTTIDLTSANFTDSSRYDKLSDVYIRPHFISLYKSNISKIRLDYVHFRLMVDSVETRDLITTGSQGKKIRIPKDEVEGIYEALLDNFKKNGQMESFKLLDIEYSEYKMKNSGVSNLSIFPKYWWNFGYNKEWVFKWTALLIIIFTTITFFILEYLNKVYKIQDIDIIPAKSIAFRNFRLFFKRVWLAFFFSSAIFFTFTLRVEAINYKKIKGTLFLIFMYSIGLVCIAYIANYIIQK